MPDAFVDLNGDPCNFDTWEAIMRSDQREITYETIEIDGRKVIEHTRYCGTGGRVFKTTLQEVLEVDEKPTLTGFHGYNQASASRADAETEHARVKTECLAKRGVREVPVVKEAAPKAVEL